MHTNTFLPTENNAPPPKGSGYSKVAAPNGRLSQK